VEPLNKSDLELVKQLEEMLKNGWKSKMETVLQRRELRFMR
jgi:hypothetical protein